MKHFLLGLGLCLTIFSHGLLAQVDSDMPEEGPLPIAKIPTLVKQAASKELPGFLPYKARFRWLEDAGTYLIDGRHQGKDTQIWVTGEGKVRYVGVRSE